MTVLTAHTLRNHEDGMAYMIECTLATVAGLLLKKKPPKSELNRQITIAQTGLNCLGKQQYDNSCPHLKKITEQFDNSVQAWADDFRSRSQL
jgi:hypothetical protein